ncbi:MAG: TVP38/TMEM64 family protein [Geminicoccales bacterium]
MIKVILGSIIFVGLVLAGLIYFDVQDQVHALLTWVDHQGLIGPLLFVLIMALVVILLIPGIMLTTGAGFAFGVIEGSVAVVLGTTLGATVAFLLARYGFGDRTAGIVRRHARLKAVSDQFATESWKIVLVTRLVPFFPFKLSNYVFGLTKIPLRGFVGGTLIGEIPLSVHNVYLGSIAADLATLGQRQTERTHLEWALYGIGFAVAMISVLYLGLWAKRVLSTYDRSGRIRSDGDALA